MQYHTNKLWGNELADRNIPVIYVLLFRWLLKFVFLIVLTVPQQTLIQLVLCLQEMKVPGHC